MTLYLPPQNEAGQNDSTSNDTMPHYAVPHDTVPPRPVAPPARAVTPTQPAAPAKPALHGYWWKVLLGGLGLWVMTVAVTILTRNANLVPTLILVGSFLVPFAATLLAIQQTSGRLGPNRVLMAFFVGGIFGVLAASILEAKVSGDFASMFAAGFIEEAVKLGVLAFAARKIAQRTPAVGAWLGAVVGAGFAAFESAGYALNSSLTDGGIDLLALLQTEAVRGLLAPAGHVLWTAIAGAALFAVLGRLDARRAAMPKAEATVSTWIPVGLTYLGLALLHSAWDLVGTAAQYVAIKVTGVGGYEAAYGFTPRALIAQAQGLADGLYMVGILIVTLIGVGWLVTALVRGRSTRPRPRPATPLQSGYVRG